MNTLIDTAITASVGVAVEEAPSTIKTTLYDLIATLQIKAGQGEEELVVAIVVQLLRSGRVKFLSAVSLKLLEKRATYKGLQPQRAENLR